MKPTIYLDKRRDVEVMRRLQRMQRARKRPVVIRHHVFADLLGCSVSSIRRSINALVESGHIKRTYVSRPTKGGFLPVYEVNTYVIYRVASLVRRATRAIEQLKNRCNDAQDKRLASLKCHGSGRSKINRNKINRSADYHRMPELMAVAQSAGIDDRQRGYLRGAARKYGVVRAWEALVIAFERGYQTPDLVRVTWGILKRQEGIT